MQSRTDADRVALRARRLANLPRPTYPDDLPVVARRAEIAKAIAEHQVVIVSGETGSGKTTQLPKICLDLGRGVDGMIGHTQPRRIAARAVATRVAAELNTPLGGAVGYKVRFSDKVSADSYIKVMTDGILLAESQRDRMLSAYDTLIIDEAHERSLNIDFLLGYLQRLLPRRPEMKLIVTSATIDAQRFAQYFARDGIAAPVIEVSGRMYPVEIRYRPLGVDEEDQEDDLETAIVDAVGDLTSGPHGGDVLVFLPGEREIRSAADALSKQHLLNVEILPLYARMSFEEQDRVFRDHIGRRVVLSTNVAETSLTVPGIRYVVDTGLARVNRYSYRNKVELLQIEKVSRASANQRAGRCGRVAAGICVRLYGEDDYTARPEFSDPEILRSSLAGVILRMKSLGIGEVENFPFVDAPAPRMIADGYQLLSELGAVDERNQLTRTGRQLAKFPIDPRIARMILAARQHNCLQEMLTIAAALEVQDPRERPFDRAAAADQAHAEFNDDKSDFAMLLKLWEFFEHALATKQSNRQLAELLKKKFLSQRRMREWRDVRAQLQTLATEMGMQHADNANANSSAASTAKPPATSTTESTVKSTSNAVKGNANKAANYEQIHRALLAGLLGNVGVKTEEGGEYAGARGIRFQIFPGSGLRKAKPKWVVAAELTDTARLYARCVAKVEPEWVEAAALHLVKREYVDPFWDKPRAMVVAYERVTLYGLTLISRRRVHYGPINPKDAREVFLRQALAAGEYETRAPFYAHNQSLIREILELEHKARRPDVLVDDEALFRFYDERVPADIFNGTTFETWRKQAESGDARLLFMTREYLMQHAATGVNEVQFPETITVGEVALRLKYRFEPGHPLDGVTMTAPLHLLNQIDEERMEWLVPGMVREKVTFYFKALPKTLRRYLFPVNDQVTAFLEDVEFASMPLTAALRRYVQRAAGEPIAVDVWAQAQPPLHLKVNYRVVDDAGNELAMGRDLAALKTQLGAAARLTFAQSEPGIERDNVRTWDFGDLPAQISFTRDGRKLAGYPALDDDGDSAAIRLFDTADAAQAAMREGVRRLLQLDLKEQIKQLEKNLPGLTQAALQLRGVISVDQLREDWVTAIADRAFIGDDDLPRSAAEYEALRQRARTRLPAVREAANRLYAVIAAEYHAVALQLGKLPNSAKRVATEVKAQLSYLVYPGAFVATPWERLQHLPRYLKAAAVRLAKFSVDPERDARHALEISALWKLYEGRAAEMRKAGASEPALEDFRWQIEELRVSLFAQELRTPQPISVKRLKKSWDAVVH